MVNLVVVGSRQVCHQGPVHIDKFFEYINTGSIGSPKSKEMNFPGTSPLTGRITDLEVGF